MKQTPNHFLTHFLGITSFASITSLLKYYAYVKETEGLGFVSEEAVIFQAPA